MSKYPSPPIFVNRLRELKQIQDKIQIIKKQKLLFSFIITISGIPGIGKTTLLAQAKQEAERQRVHIILIDCEEDAFQNNPIYILQYIARHLFEAAMDWQEVLKEYQDNQGHPAQPAFYQGRVIEVFTRNLKLYLEKMPLLLLIDNSHRMNEVTQEILEDILERIYHQNKLLVILGGRTDIRWHSFELRRRTQTIALNSFPKTEAAKLLPDPSYAMLTDQVYTLTQGYPMASVLAYQWVLDNFTPSEVDLSSHFKARESDLIFNLFGSIFEDHILRDIKDSETRHHISQLLRYISPLRRFDDNLLAALLPYIDKGTYGSINTLNARVYTRQMSALTYLVKWNSARQAYALDASIRRLLSLEMKFRDEKLLIQIHEFMMNWYQQAIDEVTTKDSSAPQSVIYLIEYIFHFAQFSQLKNESKNLEEKIKQKVTQLFEGYYMREQVHFQEEFKKDEDLAELLGDIYNRLNEFVAHQVEPESQD